MGSAFLMFAILNHTCILSTWSVLSNNEIWNDQSSCKRDTKYERLAPVRVFTCKHLLRLRKTSPFAVKSIPSFTNFKKSFKTFRFYQSSLRLIYLNPLTRFSRSYALIIKERARALRSLRCLRNIYRCKNIFGCDVSVRPPDRTDWE